MITILLGPDDFSKREYVRKLAAEKRAEAEFFVDDFPGIEQLTSQDLFSKPKVKVLVGLFSQVDWDRYQKTLIESSYPIVLIEEKIDKRSTKAKEVLKDKNITIKEFNLPHGKELNTWLQKRIESRGGNITPKALELLAVRLGRDEAKETKFGGKVVDVTEVFNLWQAANEIEKLLALAAGRTIEEVDVHELVGQSGEVDVFEIINAAAEGNKTKTLQLVNKFLSDALGSDEKAKIIQLNALLSDQFRNVALAQYYTQKHFPEADILEQTGWKSGRLFVLKKIAAKFAPASVISLLNKLESLDEELKTSSTPPRVILDLILAQL